MSGAQSSADRKSLPIDIARLIAGQEQHRPRHFICNAASFERIELANLPLRASRSRGVVHGLSHSRLDDARTDGIAADAGARKLVRARLHDGDDGGLGSRVIGAAGVRSDACHRGGADDGAGRIRFVLQHGLRCVFRGQEDAECVGSQEAHEVFVGRVCEQLPA